MSITQGKWKVKKISDNLYVIGTNRKGPKAEANCPICTFGFYSSVISDDEAEDHAQLIAAAPELLAACEALIDECETFNWNASLPRTIEIDGIIAEAKQAIDNAKGAK